ncbi:MAG: DUF433 domain-containing protein [Cyanobacteria bacterium J06636_16]
MVLLSTDYKHIQINEQGIPVIAGTTMKVTELITSVKAYGWGPDELHANYPHISMGQIYSALAYYWDHKEAVDAEIERIDQWVANAHQQVGESRVAQKLRERGLL